LVLAFRLAKCQDLNCLAELNTRLLGIPNAKLLSFVL